MMQASAVSTLVRDALQRLGTPGPSETLVAALSGGADSVALLDALQALARELGFGVVAAHLDHRLRPDSGADAEFCRRLCAGLGVEIVVGEADVQAQAAREGGGLEQAARVERYAFLRRVRAERGATAIALAHTRDDQAETFLLRLLRGSGSAGLASMRARSGDLLRPLLRASRADVLDHLQARGLHWREDPTNADRARLRNRVRHELLPYLEQRFNPRIRASLARSAGLLADEADALAPAGRALLELAARREGDALALDTAALAAAPRAVARLALRGALESAGGLRGVSTLHVERLLGWALSGRASGRSLAVPGGREAAVVFDRIHIGPRASGAGPFAHPLPVPGRVELPGGRTLVAAPDAGPAVSNEKMAVVPLPEDAPLAVRTRYPGDRVHAKGRDISLKRFLQERHVPSWLREALPLVAAGRQVLWVPGLRVDPCAPQPGRPFVRLELAGTGWGTGLTP